MLQITDEEFEKLVGEGIDAIPDEFYKKLDNVAITMADFPTPYQMQKGRVRYIWALLGLYEGVPQTSRNNNYSGILPDKITIFKYPILRLAQSPEHLKELVKNTVWHEVAHHFGLGHGRIHELERKSESSKK